MEKEETEKGKKKEEVGTAQVSEESMKETQKIVEGEEDVKEEEQKRMVGGDLGAVQESIVEKAVNVECVKETSVERKDAVKQELTCVEKVEQIKDINQEAVQVECGEKTCMEETKQEATDVDSGEGLKKTNMEQVQDVNHAEAGKEKTDVEETFGVNKVDVEHKTVTVEETTNEEQGEGESKTGVGETAQKCSPHPHTVPSPQNDKTEKRSNSKLCSIEEFNAFSAFKKEKEEEMQEDKNKAKGSSTTTRGRMLERKCKLVAKPKSELPKEDTSDKCAGSVRSLRCSLRPRVQVNYYDQNQDDGLEDEDLLSDKHGQHQESLRKAHKRDKTQTKKRSAEDEGRLSKRTRCISDQQNSQKDTSPPKEDGETATQLHSIEHAKLPSTSTSRRQEAPAVKGSCFTSHDVTQQKNSVTAGTTESYNTPLVSGESLKSEPKVTDVAGVVDHLDRNMQKTEDRMKGSLEIKEEKVPSEINRRVPQVFDIERINAYDKQLDFGKKLSLCIKKLPSINEYMKTNDIKVEIKVEDLGSETNSKEDVVAKIDQNLSNKKPEPSKEFNTIIKQSKANERKTPENKVEKMSLQGVTNNRKLEIGTNTRSARKRSVMMAVPKRSTRSNTDIAKDIVKKEAIEEIVSEMSKEETTHESKPMFREDVCPQNTPLRETVKNITVSEGSQEHIPLESTASEETVNEDKQRNTPLNDTVEEQLCKAEIENNDSRENTLLPEDYRTVNSEEENKNDIRNHYSGVLKEEKDRCIAEEETLEHCKKTEVLGVAQENIQESKPLVFQKENSERVSSEEDRPEPCQQEHPQDQDKAGHTEEEDKLKDTHRKDIGDNSQECISQEDKQENVPNSIQTEDKCETSQNTIKEEDKPTQTNDEEKNSSTEDNHSKEDTDSRETHDMKSSKRPLECEEVCAKRKRKDSAEEFSDNEHKNNEGKEKDECNTEGGIKEDNDTVKDIDGEAKTQEAKTSEKDSKESTSVKMGRYSKVVVVGDARMSLLATADIREQLKDVTQVILVPNLTLEGVLEVVQKEVVKEECPRGILLLCLAGLHGTLVECRVPEECRSEGHSDMQEMVPATKDDFLDPKFPKQLAKLKKKLRGVLGRGSHVLFFPVLPVDMANYNAIAAKQHFDATGHKLSHLPEMDSFNYQSFQHYTEAIDEVNGSSLTTVRLVPYEFCSKNSCKIFMDDQLQDGFRPKLDLVKRHIVPHLQRTTWKHHTLRFQQVVLVGDARLGQVVTMQQQKGVEPCSFILQEEPGLKSLTPDSSAVKQLSGMCDALIFLTVSLKDLGAPPRDKTKCFLPHDCSEAFNNFLQEAQRVDQMLHLATHRCTIITTPVMPYNSHTLTRDKAQKISSCDMCKKTIKSVTHKTEQVTNILGRKNALPAWDLNRELRDRGDSSSSRHGSSLSSEVVWNAASTWEYFLTCCQVNVREIPCVTITSVLQDPQVLSIKQPNTKETSRNHSNYNSDEEQACGNHKRDREMTQDSHNKDQMQDRHNKDKKQAKDSHKRDKKHKRRCCSKTWSASIDLDLDIISHTLSSGQKDNITDPDSYSLGSISLTPSPCSSNFSSPNHSMDTPHVSPSQTSHTEQSTEPLTSPKLKKPSTSVTSLSSHKNRPRYIEKDRPPSLQKHWQSKLDEPSISSNQKGNHSSLKIKESIHSSPKYSNQNPHANTGTSRSGSRDRRKSRSIEKKNRARSSSGSRGRRKSRSAEKRNIVRRRSTGRSKDRSKSRSHGPRKRLYGRSRSGSPARPSLSPKRKPVYRRSLSRSPSPLPCYRSIPGGASCVQDRRSTSRSRRSVSRGKRSISRGRSVSKSRRSISRGRSVSRSRRSISRGGRSISRTRRSISRGRRSVSRTRRSISEARRSVSRSRRSVSRSRKSVSRGKRHISRDKRSVSRSKRSVSRCQRSISRDRRSASRGKKSNSRGRRSTSSGRSVSRGKRSTSRDKRLFFRGKRSISRGRRSISRSRKSISRGRKSISRDRKYISRGRRSVSRGRRSMSRDRKSISRGRKYISRDRRSLSRGRRSSSRSRRLISKRSSSKSRSASRRRSISTARSVSKGKSSIFKGDRSTSRGRRSISRSRRSISRGKRSVSQGRRSISRDRRSVSRSRRSVSRGKRSVSRNRRSISRGKRSVSRGRRSISKDRSVSRNRRSLSRGKRSVSRGRRGRSSSREQHNTTRLPGHTPSTQQKLRRNTVEEALKTLRSVHEKECEMYRSNPTIHPDIGAEYRQFCDKKIQSIVALGGDPTQYNMASEWQTFWVKRMEEIFLQSWKTKKEQCLKVLDNQKRQSAPHPSIKTHRSSSVSSSLSSSSSSFSSSSSCSSSCAENRKRSKKKKRKKKVKRKSRLSEGGKRKRKSSLSEVSKRKRKKRSTEMAPTKSHPRGKLAERKPSCSNEYEERFPRDHSKTTLRDKGVIKKDFKVIDSTLKKVPYMLGEVKREEQVKKPAETQAPNCPEVAQPSKGEQSQGVVLSCKEKINRQQPSPPQINRKQPSPPQINRQLPSPPQINRQQPSPPQINRQQPSPPQINRQLPTPPQIAGMRQQGELDEEYRKWRLPSPINQPAIRRESKQHTSKPGVSGVMSMDEPVPSPSDVKVEARVEQPEKHRVSPHDIVQRLWLQLSGKKCVGGNSGNAEAPTSEAQRQQDSRKTLDSKIKEGNLKNTISSQPQGNKEQPAWQEALSFLTSIQEGRTQQGIRSMDTKQPVNRVTATVPPNQARDMKVGYSLSNLGEKETQEDCGSDQHHSKSTTQPLSIFSSNSNNKPGTSTHAKHSTASEAQGKQDSMEHLQPNMKERNVKNTIHSQSQGYMEQPGWQGALSLTSIQESWTHQGIHKMDTKQPVNRVTATVPPNQARDMKSCHNLSRIEEKDPQKACNTLRNAQHGSDSTTRILNSFTPNTSNKPGDAKNTKHSCQDEISSTTALDKSTKVDVMKVLEVLIHLEDKLGTHCVPLKLLQLQAKELQSNAIDPVTIMNDKDNMLLLQMIQEKLQGILKDSKLSIIKKFIVQEAEQRLSVLLDLHKHHKLLGSLSLTEVAHRCRDMDATTTLSYICDMLQCQGHTHVPQEQLVNLYKSIKAEQRILGRSCHNKMAGTTTTTLTDNSESSHLQLSGGSGSLPHGSTFKVAFVGHEYIPTHFACSGCEVRLYRAPGGKVQNFSNDPRMNKVLQWPHDLTILFLGSNDIYENCEAISVVDKIIQIADLIRGTCDSKVAITLIEPRNIRYCDWISQELYDMVSTSINRKLQTDMKEQCFIDITTKLNAADLQKDRMYWNDKGRTLVDNEFRNIILKFKHIHDVIQSVIG